MKKNIFRILLIIVFSAHFVSAQEKGKPEIVPQLAHDIINCITYSPDGKQILSGSIDCSFSLWDISTGKELRTFLGHTSFARSLCFSPDGKYIAYGGI